MGAIAPALQAQEQLLAFPGAEGFGRYTTGGRGGEIYHVTNLNDAGAGSLRDAVSKPNRIVVFDVAGTIYLKSQLSFKGNLTVLGQTAPGEGIQVYGHRVTFSGASNLIIRNMRFRMGVKGPDGTDACGVAHGTDMIFDHLSVLWGRDETFSVSWDNKEEEPARITIQNSIIGQGLQSHSAGGLIQTDGGVTLYRNLYIENNTRNPKVKGLNQYVNNVVYNWGSGGCYIMGDTESATWAQIENNYYVRGPWGGTKPHSRGSSAFHYYGVGNYYDDNRDGILNGTLMDIDAMNGMQTDGRHSTWVSSLDSLNNMVIHEVIHEGVGTSINYDVILSEQDRTIPAQIPVIENIMTAEEALLWMVDNVGPVLPVRDEVDEYLLEILTSYGKKGTPMGITNETTQLLHGGTGSISGGVKPLDTDGDGIPDAWETANGLNPNDPTDAKAIAANGYANIENYSFTITEAYPYIKKPLKLKVTRQGMNDLDLSWDVNKNTTHGFVVELSADGGNTFTQAATAPAGATTATVDGLTEGTPYQVRVYAAGDGLQSDCSNVVTTSTTSGISPIAVTEARILPIPGGIEVTGLAADTPVTIIDLTGRTVATAKGPATFRLLPGLYIVSTPGLTPAKVMVK